MKQHKGIWLPDHEEHMVQWCDKNGEMIDGKTTYQYSKLRAAMFHVKQFRTAVDVGAHVGFWSMHLAKKFDALHAFEPIAGHRECFLRNVVFEGAGALNACALGAVPKTVGFEIPHGSSGGTHVKGAGDIEMRRLDDFEFQDVDFLKIDCEGYELDVLAGGIETIKRCRPCVIVEQKAHIMAANFGTKGRPACDFLVALGAKLRKEISGDFIYSWD